MSAKTKPQPEIRTKPPTPLTVSREAAAELLSVDVQTVDRLISGKKLNASKPCRRVLVRYNDIVAMLDATAM